VFKSPTPSRVSSPSSAEWPFWPTIPAGSGGELALPACLRAQQDGARGDPARRQNHGGHHRIAERRVRAEGLDGEADRAEPDRDGTGHRSARQPAHDEVEHPQARDLVSRRRMSRAAVFAADTPGHRGRQSVAAARG
jgi:hypothetical protein